MSKGGKLATPRAVAKTLSVFSPDNFSLDNGFPRACPRCGVMSAETGFAVDRSKASGRKSHCRTCDARRANGWYAEHREELYAQREAVRKAAWQAHLKRLAVESKKRFAEQKKLHAAQTRHQKAFLRSIGVPDLSPEEVSERAHRRAQERL